MTYLYFKFKRDSDVLSEIKIKQEAKLRVVIPSLKNFHNLLWFVLSLGRLREYQMISDENKVLSKAQVMPKILIFDFMKSGGIHIGPCSTIEKSRGKGYYPFLLRQVIIDYKKVDTFYIFCDEDNLSSKKGIEKVGFKLFAKGIKKSNIYVIKDNI